MSERDDGDAAEFNRAALALELYLPARRREAREAIDELAVEVEFGRVAGADKLRLVPLADGILVRRRTHAVRVGPVARDVGAAEAVVADEADGLSACLVDAVFAAEQL